MDQLNDLEQTILELLGRDGVTGLRLGSLGMDHWKMWLPGFTGDWNDPATGGNCHRAIVHLAELAAHAPPATP